MVAFHTVKPGDTLYECHREKMGNTTMSRMGCWPLKVLEVHENHVVASWNGNPPRSFSRFNVKQWRRTPLKAKP
jgi:hypothetical protein